LPENATITNIDGIRRTFRAYRVKVELEEAARRVEAEREALESEREKVRLAKMRQKQLITENRIKHKQ
jgi:uncharacterized protein (DUF3084 family)